MDRRKQLDRYVEDTRRNQRVFNSVLAPLLALALLLLIWSTGIGLLALLGIGVLAVTGHWVLYAHLASHRTQLAELERRAQPPQGPQTGGHRRWNRTHLA